MIQRLALLSLAGCSILGNADSGSNVERGTVHILAFTEEGDPAEGADVLVHDSYGDLVARGKVTSNGTADVDSVADATVSVVIQFSSGSSVFHDFALITSFASVPLDATLHFGTENIAVGAPVTVDVELPPVTPEPLAYIVDIGCGDLPFQHSSSFQLKIPAGCAAQPRTILVKAFSSNASTTGVSVLQGVDLARAGSIKMPAFEELRSVTVDVAGHDPANGVLFGSTTVLNDGGSFNFIGDEGPTGHVTAEVPPGPWEGTRYKVLLPFLDDGPVRSTELVRFEPGEPHAVTIPEADFLALPGAKPGDKNPFAFTFEGNPDFRSVYVTYNCNKCGLLTAWNFVAPAGPDAIELPELPADLKKLSPVGATFHSIEARYFDSTALDDYPAFLASGLTAPGDSLARSTHAVAPEPGTTDRFTFFMLLDPTVHED